MVFIQIVQTGSANKHITLHFKLDPNKKKIANDSKRGLLAYSYREGQFMKLYFIIPGKHIFKSISASFICRVMTLLSKRDFFCRPKTFMPIHTSTAKCLSITQ